MENNVHLDDGDVIYVPSIDYARVYVLGEVLRPMAVPVRTGRISLAEAVAEAGGFNETTAYKSQIKIIRGGMADAQVFTVNFNDMVKGKVPDYAMLKPGDIVYVPSSGLAKWDRVMGLIMPSLSRIIIDAAAINAMTNN
jgi:polysaccharide export outer membrane protein